MAADAAADSLAEQSVYLGGVMQGMLTLEAGVVLSAGTGTQHAREGYAACPHDAGLSLILEAASQRHAARVSGRDRERQTVRERLRRQRN